jgi:hypothetical protein
VAYARISLDDVIGPRPRPALVHQLAAGAVAGQVGGGAFAVIAIGLCRVFLRTSGFFPMQAIAASMTDPHAVEGVNPDAFIIGLLIHQLVPSLAWGLVFGALVWAVRPRRNAGLTLLGLAVGLVAWLVDVELLVPALAHNPDLWNSAIPLPIGLLAHLAYGLGLSLLPWKFDPIARTFD